MLGLWISAVFPPHLRLVPPHLRVLPLTQQRSHSHEYPRELVLGKPPSRLFGYHICRHPA